MEEQASSFLITKRYAVVTGANRGIGFGVCKKLAINGVIVILTARDEKKGLEAIQSLRNDGISDHLLFFHQLDVMDSSSVSSLAEFIESQFGKLDILVNNAGVGGVIMNEEAIKMSIDKGIEINWKADTFQTYDLAIECLETNYFGMKRITNALMPFLQLSNSPRIVNVSSAAGKLQGVNNPWAVNILNDEENLTEARIDEVVNEFLRDFESGLLETKGWPSNLSALTISKAAMNGYTRIMAKRHHERIGNFMINSVCPGFIKTRSYFGLLTIEEGADNIVRVALLPDAGPSGLFFSQKDVSSF